MLYSLIEKTPMKIKARQIVQRNTRKVQIKHTETHKNTLIKSIKT